MIDQHAEQLTADHLGLHRIVLFLLAVNIPILGLLPDSHPRIYDPMWARWALCVFGLGMFGLSFVVDRAHVRRVTFVNGLVAYLWFIYAFARNGLPPGNVVGLVLLVCIVSFATRTVRELVGTLTLITGSLVYLYVATASPVTPLGVVFLMFLLLNVGFSWMGISRYNLECELQNVNRNLEERIADRTSELRATIDRLDAEIITRIRAEHRANAANLAKSRFLENMSHELRTPLNAITGYTALIGEELEDRSIEGFEADLDHVQTATDHLVGLIDAILDLSRIEHSVEDLAIGPTMVGAVVDAVVPLIPGLNREGLHFTNDVGDVSVLADGNALRRVLINLLSNAVKFTDEGDVRITATLESGRVGLHVEDTGVGIPPDAVDTIFERFVQADNSSTRVHDGAGLGLAISKRLIEQMGGELTAHSVYGQGSRFTAWLPSA